VYDYLISAFTTMFVILDPPGLVPVFIAATAGISKAHQRVVAIRAVATAAGILVFFAVAGGPILDLLGISLEAFRIAGGVLMFWIAFEMVFEKRQDRKVETAERIVQIEDLHGLAVFPLAIPLISGPGAISATVLLASQAPNVTALFVFLAMLLVIMATILAGFMLAEPLSAMLGPTGRAVTTRLFGLLLAAMAVQIVVDAGRAMLMH